MLLFGFISCFVPGDHWEITFVIRNRFCLLHKTSHSLFNGQYQAWWNTNQKYMKLHASFTSYLKYYRKVLVIKSSFCLVVLDELLHQQISFFTSFFNFIWYCLKKRFLSEIFFPSFNIVWEKDGFTQTYNPINGQNLLSVTKSFRPCSLTFSKESLPYFACAQ